MPQAFSKPTLLPRDLLGRVLRLVKPDGNETSMAWRVLSYSSGSLRVQLLPRPEPTGLVSPGSSGLLSPSSIDWPDLRQYLNSGFLRLED